VEIVFRLFMTLWDGDVFCLASFSFLSVIFSSDYAFTVEVVNEVFQVLNLKIVFQYFFFQFFSTCLGSAVAIKVNLEPR
jgi:hypothetical protein